MRTHPLACAVLLALSGASARADQTTAAMLGSSETLVSVCAGLNTGNGWGPGGLVPMVPGRQDCQSATTVSPSQALARTAAYQEPGKAIAASAQGQAQMGQMSLATWMNGDNKDGLSAGFATGGWNDRLTLAPLDPALNNQLAYLEFQVHVTGSLSVTNTANAATGLSMVALRDDGLYGAWSEQAFGVVGNLPVSRTIDKVATLAVAAPLGVAFDLGFFASAYSSGGSSLPGPNEAENDFQVTWLGISEVSVNGTPVAYSLFSQSGIDWNQAFTTPVPEPASALLMLAGVGVLLARWRAQA